MLELHVSMIHGPVAHESLGISPTCGFLGPTLIYLLDQVL